MLLRSRFSAFFPFSLAFRGAVAQLGERLNGIQEVVGSIPISSTNLRYPSKKRDRKVALFLLQRQLTNEIQPRALF